MQIKKAVFPVAGMGTRFLPATKANPKEMLPVVDKPLIQYAVEDAIAAGITDLIFVTSSSKQSIEDFFDSHFELEQRLQKSGKLELLNLIRNIKPANINCIYVRQPEPLGLGDAVLRAKSIVGDEPFAVLLADDLMVCPQKTCLQQMCETFTKTQASLVAVEPIATKDIDKYGMVDVTKVEDNLYSIQAIVEKPKPEHAPSNLGAAGRYILTPRIFECLEKTERGAGNEIQLTDAIGRLLEYETAYAVEFDGKRYDCGSKLGYLKATVMLALQHDELRDEFRAYLNELQNYF